MKNKRVNLTHFCNSGIWIHEKFNSRKTRVDGFVFLLLYIYGRPYHRQLGKHAQFPILRLFAKISSFQIKRFKFSCSNKYILLNLHETIFGKYLLKRKRFTRFAWLKPLQKHLAIFIDLLSLTFFKDPKLNTR